MQHTAWAGEKGQRDEGLLTMFTSVYIRLRIYWTLKRAYYDGKTDLTDTR